MVSLIQKAMKTFDEVSVVVSVWDKAGKKEGGAFSESQMYRLFDPEIVPIIPRDKFGQRFKNNFDVNRLQQNSSESVEQFLDKLKNSGATVYSDIVPSELLNLEMSRFSYDGNSMKSMYLSWRASRIRRNIERTSGRFDFVIKVRPDLDVQSFNFEKLITKEGTKFLLIPGFGERDKFINDIFAIGDSESMACYENFFGYLIYKEYTWTGIHEDLFEYLQRMSLQNGFELINAGSFGFKFFIVSAAVCKLNEFANVITNPVVNRAFEIVYGLTESDGFEQIKKELEELNMTLDSEQRLSETSLYNVIVYAISLKLRKESQTFESMLYSLLNVLSVFESKEVWQKRLENNSYHIALQFSIALVIANKEYSEKISQKLLDICKVSEVGNYITAEEIEYRVSNVLNVLSKNENIKKHAIKIADRYEKNNS